MTAVSVLAGLAPNGTVVIAARASSRSRSCAYRTICHVNTNEPFHHSIKKNKAMGFWGAAAPAGGTAGVFLGGIVTAYVDWSWVFLINLPVGIAVLALTWMLITQGIRQKGRVDYLGAFSITGALILLVYAIVAANDAGWTSLQTVSLLLVSAALLGAVIIIQKRSREPLMPLRVFRTSNLLASNVVMALLGAAWMPMWFFINLYLQQIQGYGPFESGLALLPMTAAIMILMIGASSRLISRLGIKHSLVAGLGLLAVAMLLFVTTPSSKGSFVSHVLPASLVAAVGMSLAYIPALMSAVSHARKEESGLASGIVNTSYQIGSALGLAVMVVLASAQTLQDSNDSGEIGSMDALNNGFHLAFIGTAIVAATAAAIALIAIKKPNKISSQEEAVMAAG